MTVRRRPAPPDRAVLESTDIPADAPPVRLDRAASTYLAAFPTRASARKAALRGELAVGGEVSEPARWVAPGDHIAWIEPDEDRVPDLDVALPVVYEDDVMAVVHKPGGWATSGNVPRTLARALPVTLAATAALDRLRRPQPVHRLDAPTAGLVVCAKTRRAHAELGWAFQSREVYKRYRAVVVGRLGGTGSVQEPIDGRPAVTRYRAVGQAPAVKGGMLTRVDAWPETGRTHQIRRHLAALGTPVLGDARYGLPGLVLRGKGLFLFAVEVRLAHPITGRPMCWTLPEPPKVGALFARESRRCARIRQGTAV